MNPKRYVKWPRPRASANRLTGRIDWLFPQNSSSQYSSGSNPLAPKQVVQLPSKESERALYLDKTTGIEHIYVVYSASRWVELEEALSKPGISAQSSPAVKSVLTALAKPVQEPNGLRVRGVGGTHTIPREELLSVAVVVKGEKLQFTKASSFEAAGSFFAIERWFNHVSPQ